LVLGIVMGLTVQVAAKALVFQRQDAPLSLVGHWVPMPLRGTVTALLPVSSQPPALLAATTNGVWHSTDAGATWQPDGSGTQGRAIFTLAGATNGAAAWAGSFDGTVYTRDSAGTRVSWRRISPVLRTDPFLGSVPIYSLAVSPLPGHPILVGSMGAIFRGEPNAGDRAWRWIRVWQWPGGAHASPGSGAVTSLLAAPWDRHTIFASLFEANPPVLISHDDGRSWASYAANLPASLPVQDLAAGTAPARLIFLTTMGGGVWRREAGGAWQDISAGLPQRHAMPLVEVGPPSVGVLYAGTMASGVYEKVGNGAWRPLGRGLTGLAATVLGLVETTGAHPVLLAATTSGVYGYVPGR
jgi:hypothetical protein